MSVKVSVKASDTMYEELDLYIEHESGKTMMYELSVNEAKEAVNALLNAVNEFENGTPELSRANQAISGTFSHAQQMIKKYGN